MSDPKDSFGKLYILAVYYSPITENSLKYAPFADSPKKLTIIFQNSGQMTKKIVLASSANARNTMNLWLFYQRKNIQIVTHNISNLSCRTNLCFEKYTNILQ